MFDKVVNLKLGIVEVLNTYITFIYLLGSVKCITYKNNISLIY